MPTTLRDRLRARSRQLGLSPAGLAAAAGVNRSFVYDILRARSGNPGAERLDRVAAILKVDRDWLLHGVGQVEGPLLFEDPGDAFVAIAHVAARASMGTAAAADDGMPEGPYHFRRAWLRDTLKVPPSMLRVLQVEGDSMRPTLEAGDTVLVDLMNRTPKPPGIFVLNDGSGLVARRLEYVPLNTPPRLRIISDNTRYPACERAASEIDVLGRIRWFARAVPE
jgi:phage repressor protein C with HTH and peptisase S24 domain